MFTLAAAANSKLPVVVEIVLLSTTATVILPNVCPLPSVPMVIVLASVDTILMPLPSANLIVSVVGTSLFKLKLAPPVATDDVMS